MPKSLFHCLFFEFLLIDFIEKKRLFSIESPLISVHDSPDFIEDMPRGMFYVFVLSYVVFLLTPSSKHYRYIGDDKRLQKL